jgi:hypothetical protein
MSRKINVYRQVDLLQARAEQLKFVSQLQVCLEFGQIYQALKAYWPHAHSLRGFQEFQVSKGTGNRQLDALLRQAWKAALIHTRASLEAERNLVRLEPVRARREFVGSLRKGLHLGAAGVRAA